MSAGLITRTGKHAWVEILSGTAHAHREAYLCVKCKARSATGWTGPGPENSVCTAGDHPFDPHVLHRQPASDAWWEPKPSTQLLIPVTIPHPSLLLGVDTAGEFHPVLFHPTRPGFVLAHDQADAGKTYRLLGTSGFRLLDTQSIAMMPTPTQVRTALEHLAGLSVKRVVGVYWNLIPQAGEIAYHFSPLERSHDLD